MKYVHRSFFLVLIFAASCSIPTKIKGAKAPEHISIIEAYTQSKLSGLEDGETETGRHIVVLWKAKTYPTTFFWRGEAGWLPCKIQKAHRISKRQPGIPQGIDYQTERNGIETISAGDTILLTVLRGGKYPVPEIVTDDIKNRLFYQTAGSDWLSIPVGHFVKKPDISMP